MKRTPLGRGTKPLARRTPLDRGDSQLERSTPLRRHTALHPKPRAPEEFARIYGSLEFLFYVHVLLLCPVCGAEDPEWAHTTNGGAGRKADVEFGTVLCNNCHVMGPNAQHRIGWPAFRKLHARIDFDLVGLRALEAFEEPEVQAWVELMKADGTFERWLDSRRAA